MNVNNDAQVFQIGLDGFIWFIGVVKEIIDPLKIGRCKVRIIGWHEDDTTLPDYDLPWAYPIRPVTQSNVTSSFKIGDWVVGFFLDGKLAQQPMIFGVLPAVPQQ